MYSEPGHGTTVNVYIPRTYDKVTPLRKKERKDIIPAGNETILIVEDEPDLRKMIKRILSGNGYNVLEAIDGENALEVIQTRGIDEIELLVADVIMPRMGGKTLTDRLNELQYNLKVIYISGYTNDAISTQGILTEGVNFLHKPFTPSQLLLKIREVLDN